MYNKQDYSKYRSLDPKLKLKLIKQACQDEKYRKENPQGTCRFLEENWIDFEVYQGKDKLALTTYRHYKSKDFSDAIGVIFMFHGLNSYLDHGAHIAHALAQIGFITVGFDHRGFGRSPGEKAFVESLESHLADAFSWVTKIRPIYANLPCFALGLSMGGLTSYHLSLRNKQLFSGVILMAPAIKNIASDILVNGVQKAGCLLGKKFKLPFTPPSGQATRNPKITEDVYSDPLSYKDKPCIRTMKMLTNSMKITPDSFPQYEANFVIIQGGKDKLVHPDGAFELFDQCKSKDKTIWFYEQMWHDIWHEQQIIEIIQKIKVWLLQRTVNKNKQPQFIMPAFEGGMKI